MGIAVLSGVVDSLDYFSRNGMPGLSKKWESHTPGTLTPELDDHPSTPSRFIACVSREESAVKLRGIFGGLGRLGKTVEVLAGRNLQAVQEADVVLLWCVPYAIVKWETDLPHCPCFASYPQLQTSTGTFHPRRTWHEGCIGSQASDQHSGRGDYVAVKSMGASFNQSYPCHAQYAMQGSISSCHLFPFDLPTRYLDSRRYDCRLHTPALP